ncbi:hypothetical protein Tco_0459973 [Tanacetum coccineum]
MEQPESSAAQQITPADQHVHSSKFQNIGRCNSFAVLPNIPCPKECRIVRQLLVDHALFWVKGYLGHKPQTTSYILHIKELESHIAKSAYIRRKKLAD